VSVLPWFCFLLVLCSACGGSDDRETALERPNIVWIVAEDMNFEIGAFGDPIARTPHLDALAAEGIRYTNVFATSGVCAPSRTALITGMYATSIGAHHMRSLGGGYQPLPPPEVKTFTEYLRAAGYYTSNLGKTDYQFSGPIGDAPLTNWDEPSGDWRGRAPGQPFFAYFTIFVTHESLLFSDRETVTDPASVTVPPYYPDTPLVRRDFARLYDNVAAMDEQVGAILEMLDEDGLADETIVFFFPDNGRGFPRDKRWVYDGGIHEPMIIRWPDRRDAGSIADRLIAFVDLAPTVLSLAGVPVPDHVEGRPFLGRQAEGERRYVFAAADRHDEALDRIRAVRDKRYKYIRNYRPELPYGQTIEFRNNLATMQEIFRLHDEGLLMPPADWYYRQTKPVEELYDTSVDPYELDNLAARPEMRAILERMRAVHQNWVEDTGDLGAIPESDLAERYWPGGVRPVTASPLIDPPGGANPAAVSISCPTEGASIAFTLESDDDPRWQLYTEPIRIEGDALLRARAVRYGYAESAETRAEFRPGDLGRAR
jgi:N-sulfoglucosamine sulfohydrolase